jgi:hypothetical protein
MTPEERRILWAAREGRLRINRHWRYVIEGEPRPARKDRENLQRQGFLGWSDKTQPILTPAGYSALAKDVRS